MRRPIAQLMTGLTVLMLTLSACGGTDKAAEGCQTSTNESRIVDEATGELVIDPSTGELASINLVHISAGKSLYGRLLIGPHGPVAESSGQFKVEGNQVVATVTSAECIQSIAETINEIELPNLPIEYMITPAN
ncbi:MAG: hypothetical protein ABIR91_04760 [Candidatus Saccharimonadales bacterium]